MTETPQVGYASLRAVDPDNNPTFWWNAPVGQVGTPNTAILMAAGGTLSASLYTVGSATVASPCNLTLQQDDALVVVNSGIDGLAVGMIISPNLPIMPNGQQILDVDTARGVIYVGGKQAMADWAAGFTVVEMQQMNDGLYFAPASGGGDFLALDLVPYGTLGVAVTPSTGVTIVGHNPDGNDGPGGGTNTDNGTAMSNSGGQALAVFDATFTDAGTYTLTSAYTSNDPNYGSAAGPALTIQVT